MLKIPIDLLIVDDERDFVEMLSLRLTDAGHRVRAAFDGDAGLAAIAEAEPDVVILDIRMPGKDGITVLKLLKASHPIVEVILLTGHGTIGTAVEGLKVGAFDYVQKPADFDELLGKLEGARLRKAEHEERIRRAEARALVRSSGDV
ncbi:MAG: response regulator [Thermoanaerobaculales bacterium]|jgi:DNA-binding NtrC family response regulator|nr:response regulator [Thermoanaerobaculales bacterium]